MTSSAPAQVSTLTSWHSDWRGLKVAVLGLGVTGFAAADTLAELGAEVVVIAAAHDEPHERLLAVIGARFALATDQQTPPVALTGLGADLVIVSPGFAPHHPFVRWVQEAGIPLWGDVELAWRLRDRVGPPAEWLLVTGTNGKTTTVQLATTMIAAAGMRVAACGNIGTPVLDAIRDPRGFDVLVVELSSYQLHYLGEIEPYTSACLNIAADHLDWHGSQDEYIRAKAKVYANTKVACVYNRADSVTEQMVRDADVQEGARAIGFGLAVPGPSDLGLIDGILIDRAFLEERASHALEITTLDQLAEAGITARHLVANVLAASALARSIGVQPEVIRDSLATFHLDAHRIQSIATAAGISWVDDSKATNAHAAAASLQAFESVVWIVGGLLKGVELDDLILAHAGRLRAAVIIGADRSVLRAAFARHAPALTVREVEENETGDVMVSAVRLAAEHALAGDVVLLAPAAASMDQFRSYAERGTLFTAAVREFLGGEADGESASHDG